MSGFRSISYSGISGALFARSFKFSTKSHYGGRGVLACGCRSLSVNLEHQTAPFRVLVISSEYRGFASVLQNPPSRVAQANYCFSIFSRVFARFICVMRKVF
ncbi:hypothetical protein QBD00_001612 [Ochrobactrum sp. AN78]|nr:hypothetical protein [Ochrobactrum sp. AN78]